MGEHLGQVVIEGEHESKMATKRKKEDDTLNDLDGLVVEDDPAEDEEDTLVYFYLWDVNKDIYSIYKLLRNFLKENYSIDSTIMLKLIEDRQMDLQATLFGIPYLHSGYISTVFPTDTSKK